MQAPDPQSIANFEGRKEKTMLLSVIEEKLMLNPSFPLA